MHVPPEHLELTSFTFPPRIEFGVGAVNHLGKWIQDLGASRPFIVTDEGVINAQILTMIQAALNEAVRYYDVFDQVQPNPTDQNVHAGIALYRTRPHDLIIGVGGGSPMDAAKAIQVLTAAPEPINQHFLDLNPPRVAPAVPLIAIPTTAGTGSEVGTGGVITDTTTNRKRFVVSGRPILALVDPGLMTSMPPSLTAGTGMDALCHCIEAYVSRNYSPIAEAIAISGIRLIREHLPTAVQAGSNLPARSSMAMAATMGGLAMSKDLGVIHALAHQLSTQCDIPHGVANSILLPHGMQFNLEAALGKFVDISSAVGVDISGLSPTEAAITGIDAVRALSQDIGLPQTLREVGVQHEEIPLMAKNAMLDFVHATNPRSCSESDMVHLYEMAF